LVEQIDHLSVIAADFSQFANIGNAKIEPILLYELLAKIAELFSVEPGAAITLTHNGKNCIVRADKTQVNRLFANLIKNALQSYGDALYRPVELDITQTGNGFAVVRVCDQGTGIDESVREKIFTPNFTTKTSGTGLGLAISKGIAEQSGGDIWFETGTGGTVFFVQLPLENTGT
jgi:two-component system, NtrC family, nitrogen regulation sensor histidine kinase NtrY